MNWHDWLGGGVFFGLLTLFLKYGFPTLVNLLKRDGGSNGAAVRQATEAQEQNIFRGELRATMGTQTEILRALAVTQQRSAEAFARYDEMQRRMLEYLEKSLALVREMEARSRFDRDDRHGSP